MPVCCLDGRHQVENQPTLSVSLRPPLHRLRQDQPAECACRAAAGRRHPGGRGARQRCSPGRPVSHHLGLRAAGKGERSAGGQQGPGASLQLIFFHAHGFPKKSSLLCPLGFDSTTALARILSLQDDILFPNLTVRETLLFAARIRLPAAIGDQAKAALVDAVIGRLGLAKAAGTLVGSAAQRGVSGGERKRVNIGADWCSGRIGECGTGLLPSVCMQLQQMPL